MLKYLEREKRERERERGERDALRDDMLKRDENATQFWK